MTIPDDQQAQAYYLAAVAVAAHEFGLRVESLAISPDPAGVPSVVLEPLEHYCQGDDDSSYWQTVLVEQYLTVLLAGGIGRLIRRQSRQSHIKRTMDGVRAEWHSLCEALACQEKEADRAYAIILAQLATVDGGDPAATIYRLWSRARRLLLEPTRRERVAHLARHIVDVRQVTGEEVKLILAK